MAVNLATKYSEKVSERFKLKSLATGFTNSEYDWTGVKTLKVYSIPTVALNDYVRTGTSRYGTPAELEDSIQEMSVTQDKAFTFTIDKGNSADQMNVKGAGKALQREIDEVIVPTEDAYVFGKIAQASVDNDMAKEATITKENAYETFLDCQTALDNKKVPTAGRIAAISASAYKFLKLDDSFIKSSELGQKMLVNGQVGEMDGVKLVKVPDSYLPANCSMIVTHPSVTVKAEKLSEYKIHNNPPGINGNLIEGRVYYDAFVLDSKKDGVCAVYSTLPAKTSA
jgi:N4-gp56 family major capsid protein